MNHTFWGHCAASTQLVGYGDPQAKRKSTGRAHVQQTKAFNNKAFFYFLLDN